MMLSIAMLAYAPGANKGHGGTTYDPGVSAFYVTQSFLAVKSSTYIILLCSSRKPSIGCCISPTCIFALAQCGVAGERET